MMIGFPIPARAPGAVLLASALVACSPAAERRVEIVERFLAEDPQVLLAADELFDTAEVFAWTFTAAADRRAWELEGLEELGPRGRRWRLQPSAEKPRLVRRLDLDAGEIHALEVVLRDRVRGELELTWAAPGEDFSVERRLTRDPPRRKRGQRTTVVFDLATHPGWRGKIERLRLAPGASADDVIELVSFRGLRRSVSRERLASAAARGWKLDLGADVRNALLALPDVPVERQVRVGAGEVLRFSYGLEPAVAEPVTFRVLGARPDGADETLFERTLGRPEAGRWHPGSIDLGAFAGDRLRLRLEVRTPAPLDLARGFPVWGNPEILGPARGSDTGSPDPEERPNVVVILVDTLRADRLSAYGYRRRTSPNIDAWAGESAVLFRHVVAQAPWTLPSHVSLFTGLDALSHGLNHNAAAPAELEMLAETLRRAGYATAAITGGGYLRPEYGFTQGFDRFRYWPRILSEVELADGVEQTLSWLTENASRPFFLFFHTYEVHYPHRERQPWFRRLRTAEPAAGGLESRDLESRGEIVMRGHPWQPGQLTWNPDTFAVKQADGSEAANLTDAEKRLVGLRYDSAIAYVDDQVARLLGHLESLGLSDRTLVVLTSDHGEALGEADRAGHNYLEDYNVLVPLIVRFPDRRGAGTVIEEQVRSIDLAPTILDVLSLAPPPLDGVSLLDAVAGDVSGLPEEAWTYASSANYGLGLRYKNRLKYVFNNTAWSPVAGEEGLYDLPAEVPRADDRRMAGFRRRVAETMEAQHRGLRLRIVNRGDGRLSGRLTGAWASVARAKVADAGCRCLHWEPGKAAAFNLAPGQEATLYFEQIPGERIGLEGALERLDGERRELSELFRRGDLGEPRALVPADAGWIWRSPADGEVAVGFVVWNVGGRPGGAELPADAEVREQLEALGYLGGNR